MGCVATPKLQTRKEQFLESEFAPYAGNGTSKIIGQAFLKTKGGDVKFGAGVEVVLVPVTAYTTEQYVVGILGGRLLEKQHPAYFKYRRTRVGDGSGNFEFENMPAGEYYLSCIITWLVAGPYGLESSGGVAHAKVKVGSGESVKVIVTR
jgi:hypothetical protein